MSEMPSPLLTAEAFGERWDETDKVKIGYLEQMLKDRDNVIREKLMLSILDNVYMAPGGFWYIEKKDAQNAIDSVFDEINKE